MGTGDYCWVRGRKGRDPFLILAQTDKSASRTSQSCSRRCWADHRSPPFDCSPILVRFWQDLEILLQRKIKIISPAHPLEKKLLFDQSDKSPVSSLVMGKSKYRHAARRKKNKTNPPQIVISPTKDVGDIRLLFLVLVFLGLLRTCLLSL